MAIPNPSTDRTDPIAATIFKWPGRRLGADLQMTAANGEYYRKPLQLYDCTDCDIYDR
jgi:hypothetical protein